MSEVEKIINSNLPIYEKSKLILEFYEKKHSDVKMFKTGGASETSDSLFLDFLKSLPANLGTLTEDYDMRRFWELSGKPKDFEEGIRKKMFVEHPDGWHAMSVIENPDRGVIEFMKSKSHPSIGEELKATTNPEFMREWITVDDPERPGYFMYKRVKDTFSYKEGGNIKGINPTETIEIGDKEYDVEIADTQEKRTIGLSKCSKLNDWEGMLFIFEEPTNSYFTMKDTSIDLDIIFIDPDGEVISVESAPAHTEDPITCPVPYQFVLEVSMNSGIKPGDELDQEDDDFSEEEQAQVKRSKMLVLDSNGDVLMTLVGGERIVSRIKTKQLIKAALKAYKSDSDTDYKRVGRIILLELIAQDSRTPQFVQK